MNIVTIGSDRNLFVKDAAARRRIAGYGSLFDELHIVVFTRRKKADGTAFQTEQIAENVWIYPTRSLHPFLYVFGAYRIALRIIARRGFSSDGTIISTQDPFAAGLVGLFVRMRTAIPLQVQVHTDMLSLYFRKESFGNMLRVFAGKYVLRRADCIRAVSERIRRSLVTMLGINERRIFTLPIYVDVAQFQRTDNNNNRIPGYDFVALMVSRFTREKHIPMAVRAMAPILQEDSRVLLQIVGDGPERDAILREAAKLGIADQIQILPWTDNIAAHYKKADVFLLPSYYEGYGRTIIEAMASGVPVVMCDVGLAGDIAAHEKNALVVPVADEGAFSAAIRRLYDNPQKRRQLADSAVETVSHLQPKSREEYHTLYKESMMLCSNHHE